MYKDHEEGFAKRDHENPRVRRHEGGFAKRDHEIPKVRRHEEGFEKRDHEIPNVRRHEEGFEKRDHEIPKVRRHEEGFEYGETAMGHEFEPLSGRIIEAAILRVFVLSAFRDPLIAPKEARRSVRIDHRFPIANLACPASPVGLGNGCVVLSEVGKSGLGAHDNG
jgi:hypothetical protein